MDFQELIKLRQSVRRYQNKPIEREKIEILIEAVHLAPSACNSQPWKLIIVDEPELKNQVAKATFNKAISFNKFATEVPVIAVLVIEKAKLIARIGGGIKNKEYPQYDIGIAAAHFCLQAAELGLGTCMMGWFDEKKIQQLLHIPQKRKIGLLITLGYPPEDHNHVVGKNQIVVAVEHLFFVSISLLNGCGVSCLFFVFRREIRSCYRKQVTFPLCINTRLWSCT